MNRPPRPRPDRSPRSPARRRSRPSQDAVPEQPASPDNSPAGEVDADYEVGYGKPPKEHRFRPGQSGNPRGKPRRSRNFTALVREALDEQVTVRESGRSRRISKREALVKTMVNKAASGDARAFDRLLKVLPANELEELKEMAQSEVQDLDPLEERILADHTARIREEVKEDLRTSASASQQEPQDQERGDRND